MDHWLRLFVRLLASLAVCLSWVVASEVCFSSESETPPTPQESLVDRLVNEGKDLSRQQVELAEQHLEANPDDLATRTRLLGYYYAPGRFVLGADPTMQARRRHIVWIIRNHPESEIAGRPESMIDASGGPYPDKAGS